jgi:hypothetical protein
LSPEFGELLVAKFQPVLHLRVCGYAARSVIAEQLRPSSSLIAKRQPFFDRPEPRLLQVKPALQ